MDLSYEPPTGFLEPSKSLALTWLVAQCYGQVSRVPGFDYNHPTYHCLAVRGGSIGDDMRFRRDD
jgi:hypothetical protein